LEFDELLVGYSSLVRFLGQFDLWAATAKVGSCQTTGKNKAK